jgi:multisubunit Na+/H+ antiporter MnhB subunit
LAVEPAVGAACPLVFGVPGMGAALFGTALESAPDVTVADGVLVVLPAVVSLGVAGVVVALLVVLASAPAVGMAAEVLTLEPV